MSTEQHFVSFLPFVRLVQPVRIAGFEFAPFKDDREKVTSVLLGAQGPLEIILSGYVDHTGKPIDDCVVVTKPGIGWDLSPDHMPDIRWATSLLFLSVWSSNQYFTRHGWGHYVNSTSFRAIGQSYKGSLPEFVSTSIRMRHGRILGGGHRHGEFKFTMPMQCRVREVVHVDEPFLTALDAAQSAVAEVIKRLRTALSFVELANTDDELITEHAEAILMASAFEQLVGSDDKYQLAKQFGDLFGQFGSAVVRDARQVRPQIKLAERREWAVAQEDWFVHRKWMEEVYDLRSSAVHTGSYDSREWGWDSSEHLVMAAQVFPLVVKLLLQREGYYPPTEEDQVRSLAVDQILSSPQWFDDEDDEDDSMNPAWKILSKVRLNFVADRFYKKHATEERGPE